VLFVTQQRENTLACAVELFCMSYLAESLPMCTGFHTSI